MSDFIRLTHVKRSTVTTHTEGNDFMPFTERTEVRKPILLRKSSVRSVWEHNTVRTVVVDPHGTTDRFDVAESFEQIAAMLVSP